MRSVRLDEQLEARLEEAARITGEPISQIIRDAVRSKCDEVLGGRLDRRLADVTGVVAAGGSSRRTGVDFAALLAANASSSKVKRRRTARRTSRRAGR